MLLLGLDPGGVGQFGWCIAELSAGRRPKVRFVGTADNALDAVEQVRAQVSDLALVEAAGIDSPLFWIARGDRRVDQTVRSAMRLAGAANVHGTVQQVNSLRGACLAQGIMAAHLLRRDSPRIRITESHPKALLWLLRVAAADRPVTSVRVEDCADFVECDVTGLTEHERDAVLGVVGAGAMLAPSASWRNLALDESDAFVPVSNIEYWMPCQTEAERTTTAAQVSSGPGD